jgi:hypothetical protein
LSNESFFRPSRPRAGENPRTGGLFPSILKKEKGARFGTPDAEMVEIHPIGLGPMNPNINLNVSAGLISEILRIRLPITCLP